MASKLNTENMNSKLVACSNAVRGAITVRALEIENDLAAGKKFPFKKVTKCNIGNPHMMRQQPITFFRQVLSMCQYPASLDNPGAIPADAVARARHYLKHLPAGTGAYSNSKGHTIVRQEVANFISQRDGYTCDFNNIFMTNGASECVRYFMQVIVGGKNDGVFIPTPRYPLYLATITLLGGTALSYSLDENKGWAIRTAELQQEHDKATAAGVTPRLFCVINPGNPTGACLPVSEMQKIIEFCHKHNMVLMADEVYQTNIYGEVPFTSFRKVMFDMGPRYTDLQLISMHSTSKGFVGECGPRGGYMELHGFEADVHTQLYKLLSLSLCANTNGQLATSLMVNPPARGSPSHTLYQQESQGILASLKRRAKYIQARFNKLPGIDCQEVAGALYAFPNITLPAGAVKAAAAKGLSADTFYCMSLLEAAGIVVVPGSGFGQAEGTFHFRITILPAENELDTVLDAFAAHHTAFNAKYSSPTSRL